MDQFSAHLDRGWELLSRNDPQGAEASARRALELEPQSPEAYNLLGYSAAAAGNAEEAIEAYRQAIALDDTYFEAMLNAAEVYIHPLRDYAEAIKMCDQAYDLAESDEEVIDALLLKLDALLEDEDGDLDEARAVLGRMPAPPYANPGHAFAVGRARYELGDVDGAMPLVEAATKSDPQHAEAHYYLGLLLDEREDPDGATEAFLRARDLDAAAPAPPWSVTRPELQRLCQEAIQGLDGVLRQYVRGARVYVSDLPAVELVADGVDPRALLLFDGLHAGDTPAARIFFYQKNLERSAGAEGFLEVEIRAALEREITHAFLEEGAQQRSPKDLN